MSLSKPYSRGSLNIITEEYQAIRLSEGCPHKCPWCYEWREIGEDWKVFPIPEIVRNKVRIVDMNLLAKPEAYDIICDLGTRRVNNKVVYYWLVCGVDYRFLTPKLARALKSNRFENIHIAWDWRYSDQKKIKGAVDCLKKVGYKDISVFMVCNHPAISYKESCKKLDLCKYWGVKAIDCWFDNQTSPNIVPVGWAYDEIKRFRAAVRKHNQVVGFGIDPELRCSDDSVRECQPAPLPPLFQSLSVEQAQSTSNSEDLQPSGKLEISNMDATHPKLGTPDNFLSSLIDESAAKPCGPPEMAGSPLFLNGEYNKKGENI